MRTPGRVLLLFAALLTIAGSLLPWAYDGDLFPAAHPIRGTSLPPLFLALAALGLTYLLRSVRGSRRSLLPIVAALGCVWMMLFIPPTRMTNDVALLPGYTWTVVGLVLGSLGLVLLPADHRSEVRETSDAHVGFRGIRP